MTDRRETTLIADPWLWDEELSPYARLDLRLRALGRPGLGPDASSREVQDAMFDLMAGEPPTPEERAAWDELRLVERRLVIDFWMYEVPADSEVAVASEPLGEEVPVPEIDVGALLSRAVDFAAALPELPERAEAIHARGAGSDDRHPPELPELPLPGPDPRDFLEATDGR